MLRLFIVAVVLSVSVPAHERQPADALRTCLADNTTGKDRKDMARWIFLAMAAHPDMKQVAAPNAPAAADESSRLMGALVTNLLTKSCVKETRAVIQGGQVSQSFQIAFAGLGELAMQELMTDPSVQESMSLFERYLDQKRLMEVLGGK